MTPLPLASIPLALAGVGLALAALPAVLCVVNLRRFRAPPIRPDGTAAVPVSVLIPARNEEARIGRTLDAVLARSEPATSRSWSWTTTPTTGPPPWSGNACGRDDRVRLERAPPLSPGWNGKQHACHALSQVASHDVMVFLDADVALAPGALARIAGER